MQHKKGHTALLLMGGWNEKAGEMKESKIKGRFFLDKHNNANTG